MADRNAIFLAFNENFSFHARACLNSLRINYPDYPTILVYYEGEDHDTSNFLGGFDRLILIDVPNVLQQVPHFKLGVMSHPATYYKYQAWCPELNEFDNILYLDVDTLILKSLNPLLETNKFLAIANHEPYNSVRIFDQNCLNDPSLLQLLKRDHLTNFNGMDDMCNAGVFVVPRRYRTLEQFDLLCRITKEYGPFIQFADQSAISLWCKMNAIEFSDQFEYNYQSTLFSQTDTKKTFNDIHIIHFSYKKPNTVEFMTHPAIESSTRKQLARLHQEYAQGIH